ncbi:sodium-bile acid cotransporter [Holotrichia oblita]|uniref:Sodium-bile acid cotransporter n=1 Tax=Holotrichia oblita TaxID=644536 RepID=A0ACB9T1D5_HOLOL|nr:sodium-bile acid cotransporter [Holotrichia oblita]
MLALCRYVYSQVDSSKWNISCDPTNPTLYVDETIGVHCNVTGTQHGNIYFMQIQSEDIGILNADDQVLITNSYDDFATSRFNMTGNFLGKTAITMKIKTISEVQYEETMPVTVIRRKRAIDHIFTASVATLVALIYINFGCALNWNEVRAGVRRPIGPVIGFISQFLFMPLLSFGLGKILFPNNTDMQLGMFFAGVAPAGGASNMWTVILGGNLSLSITMTTISNIAAFAMMPLWLFTLGKQIFDKSDIPVPYMQITTYALALLVPLFIGYLIQRYLKKTARFLARILKGFSSLLLIFIIVFAIVTNLYLFKLFSWQIVVSGLGLPWLGYVLAWIFAKICRQNSKDSLTIAIEAGIQNTGISIFLLRVVLPQPEADLTTVAPVAVATMTPIPLFLLYICQKIRER